MLDVAAAVPAWRTEWHRLCAQLDVAGAVARWEEAGDVAEADRAERRLLEACRRLVWLMDDPVGFLEHVEEVVVAEPGGFQ